MDLREIVLGISRIPYGRPSAPTADAVLAEGRGTCSTKHLLLRQVLAEHDVQTTLRHRSYTVTPDDAARRWGPAVEVPEAGLVDVHTYAIVHVDGRDVRVDVTFPLEDWDGVSDLSLQCGDGEDHDAGDDPIATKAALVARLCDPRVREPFIASLARR